MFYCPHCSQLSTIGIHFRQHRSLSQLRCNLQQNVCSNSFIHLGNGNCSVPELSLFSTYRKSQLAASAFKYCDWMKVLAASLRVGFCDHWKRAFMESWEFATSNLINNGSQFRYLNCNFIACVGPLAKYRSRWRSKCIRDCHSDTSSKYRSCHS